MLKNFICLICILLLFVGCDNTNKNNFIEANNYENEKNYIKALDIYKKIVLSPKKRNPYKEKAKNGYIRSLNYIYEDCNNIIMYYEKNNSIEDVEAFSNDIEEIKNFSSSINDIIQKEDYFTDNKLYDIYSLAKKIDLKMHNIVEGKENYIKQNIDNYKTLIELYKQAKTSQKANKFKNIIKNIKNTIDKINKESSLVKSENIIKNINNKYDIEKFKTELKDIINYKKDHLLGDGYKNLKWGMSKKQVKSLIRKPIATYSKEHITFRLARNHTYDYDGTYLLCAFTMNKLFFVKLQFYDDAGGFDVERNLEVANIVKKELMSKFSDAKVFDTSSQLDFSLADENYGAYPHGNDTYEKLIESLAFEDNYSKIVFNCYQLLFGRIRTDILYFSKTLLKQYINEKQEDERKEIEREEKIENKRKQKKEEYLKKYFNK